MALRRGVPLPRPATATLLLLVLALAACLSSESAAEPQDSTATASPYRACERHPRPEPCADSVESVLLARSGGTALREGPTLLILGRNSGRLPLDDTPAEPLPLRFRYAGFVDALDHHLVRLSRFEGGEFILVDAATTEQTHVLGPPVVSPRRTRFASTSLDLVAGHDPNGVQVWRLRPHGPVLEWELRGGASWGAAQATWHDEDALDFTLFRPGEDPMRPKGTRVRLTLRPDGLVLRPVAR